MLRNSASLIPILFHTLAYLSTSHPTFQTLDHQIKPCFCPSPCRKIFISTPFPHFSPTIKEYHRTVTHHLQSTPALSSLTHFFSHPYHPILSLTHFTLPYYYHTLDFSPLMHHHHTVPTFSVTPFLVNPSSILG